MASLITGTSLSNPLQPQFKTEELSIILQSMWKRKETRTHSRQSETIAFDAPAYARSRMEWVQKAKSLTTTLSTPVSQSSTVPYAWVCPRPYILNFVTFTGIIVDFY